MEQEERKENAEDSAWMEKEDESMIIYLRKIAAYINAGQYAAAHTECVDAAKWLLGELGYHEDSGNLHPDNWDK